MKGSVWGGATKRCNKPKESVRELVMREGMQGEERMEGCREG